jgi:hypothetical protein
VPVVAVKVEFSRGRPETVGSAVFDGGVDVCAALTTAVCWELAVWLATLFVAVTCARMVEPTSAEVSVSVFAVAPEMSTQPFPAVSQRRHWKA